MERIHRGGGGKKGGLQAKARDGYHRKRHQGVSNAPLDAKPTKVLKNRGLACEQYGDGLPGQFHLWRYGHPRATCIG